MQDNNKNDIYNIILNTFLNKMLYYKDDFKKFSKCLIEIGFSPNKKDIQGKILLHELCKVSLGFFEFIKMLVDEKNADVNAIDDDGKTPLYYTYDKEIARYLISKGANADSLNQNGQKWSDILK